MFAIFGIGDNMTRALEGEGDHLPHGSRVIDCQNVCHNRVSP
jgi:hypothetical protein